jgi:hypothetical protein
LISIDALEGVVPGLAGVVEGDIVAPVCLVNVNITLCKNLFVYYAFGTLAGGAGSPFHPDNTNAGRSGHPISWALSMMRCRLPYPCASDFLLTANRQEA